MVAAAIIHQVGRVELRDVWEDRPGVPTRRMRVMRLARPHIAMYREPLEEIVKVDTNVIDLDIHRMFGLSVAFAYWHNSWQDAWAVEELLKWEGREDEIRRDKFYGEYFGRPSQEIDLHSQRTESHARNEYEGHFPEKSPGDERYRDSTQKVLPGSKPTLSLLPAQDSGRGMDTGNDGLDRREDVYIVGELQR